MDTIENRKLTTKLPARKFGRLITMNEVVYNGQPAGEAWITWGQNIDRLTDTQTTFGELP